MKLNMDYEVRKKKIKNFIIRIYPNCEIKVSVPINASKKDIENFIENKREWIEKTLEKISLRNINVKANTEKILGNFKNIKIIKSDLNMIRLSEKSIYIYHSLEKIENDEVAKRLEKWKIEELNRILKEYLEKYLLILKKEINGYKIKKMTSAWGIYHPRKRYITFNSLLIEKDIKAIEYVVLHELCHIFFQNHKKEFWNLVEKYMYDYKIYRELLKQ